MTRALFILAGALTGFNAAAFIAGGISPLWAAVFP
jgi:hypothetical protein